MTKHEALVLTAYTGYAFAPFAEFHKYAEAVLGRAILTHEFSLRSIQEELISRIGSEAVKIMENTWAKE